jgi:hypothetical protein
MTYMAVCANGALSIDKALDLYLPVVTYLDVLPKCYR